MIIGECPSLMLARSGCAIGITGKDEQGTAVAHGGMETHKSCRYGNSL